MTDQSAQRAPKGAPLRKVLHYGLGALCTILLGSMATLTVVDVIARYWFNAPVPGAFELTQLLLASLIFLALPLTTYNGEHVEVDIFYHVAPSLPKRIMRVLGATLSAAALAVISWRLADRAIHLAGDGAVTEALSIPLAPIAWLGCITTAFSAVLAILYLAQFTLADEMLEIGKSDNG